LLSCKSFIGKTSAEDFEAKVSGRISRELWLAMLKIQGRRARRYGSSAAPKGGGKVVSIAALKLSRDFQSPAKSRFKALLTKTSERLVENL
jgi:hypothetical protein